MYARCNYYRRIITDILGICFRYLKAMMMLSAMPQNCAASMLSRKTRRQYHGFATPHASWAQYSSLLAFNYFSYFCHHLIFIIYIRFQILSRVSSYFSFSSTSRALASSCTLHRFLYARSSSHFSSLFILYFDISFGYTDNWKPHLYFSQWFHVTKISAYYIIYWDIYRWHFSSLFFVSTLSISLIIFTIAFEKLAFLIISLSPSFSEYIDICLSFHFAPCS